jgi:HlyD family secretion protein
MDAYDPNAQQPETKIAPLKPRTIALIVGGAVVIAGGLYLLTHEVKGPADDAQQVSRVQAISAVEIQTATFAPTVALNGETRPVNDLYVFAPAVGVRILELMVDAGDSVEAGQPLARLDAALAQAQMSAAEASVAEAEAAAVRATDEAARAESIRNSGALSAEAIALRASNAEAAKARLNAARAQLQEVTARMQGGFVRAPQAGIVIERTARLGAPVDGQALFRIAAGGDLEAAVQVAEADILALRPGTRATFRLVDGTEVQGTLRRLPAALDPRTRTGEAVFDLPGDRRLRAGMFLRGQAALGERQSLAAPAAAVLYDDGSPFVYVIGQDNIARRTPVLTGTREGDLIEVREGLTAGQRVAGSGGAFLQDGDTVRPIDANPTTTPAPPTPAG